MNTPRTRREKEIWQACDALWTEQGDVKRITGDAIRDQLVGLSFKKGSPNEVYRYRKTWLQTRGFDQSNSKPAATGADPLNRVVAMVREELQAEANAAIESHKQEASQQVDAANQQVTNYQQEVTQLQNAFDALSEVKQALQQQNKQLQRNLSQEQAQLAVATEKLKLITNNYEQLQQDSQIKLSQLDDNHQQSLQHLKTQFDQLQNTHQTELNGIRRLIESQQQQYLSKIAMLERQIEEFNKSTKKANLENQKLSLTIMNLNEKNEEVKVIYQQLNQQLESTQERLNQAIAEQVKIEAQKQAVDGKLAEAIRRNQSLQQLLNDNQQQLGSLQKEIAMLTQEKVE